MLRWHFYQFTPKFSNHISPYLNQYFIPSKHSMKWLFQHLLHPKMLEEWTEMQCTDFSWLMASTFKVRGGPFKQIITIVYCIRKNNSHFRFSGRALLMYMKGSLLTYPRLFLAFHQWGPESVSFIMSYSSPCTKRQRINYKYRSIGRVSMSNEPFNFFKCNHVIKATWVRGDISHTNSESTCTMRNIAIF